MVRLATDLEHLHVFDAAHRAADRAGVSFTGDSGTLGALADVGEADQVARDGPPSAAAVRPPAAPRDRARLPAAPAVAARSSASSSSIRSSRTSTSASTRRRRSRACPSEYVGFDQYRDVLSVAGLPRQPQDHGRVRAAHRARRASCSGSALAVLAHQKLKGIGIYRTIFSSTVATSVAVASVIFGTLFNPEVGLLPWLGINPQPADPRQPRPRAPRRRDHHDLADPRPHVHPHVVGPAGDPRRAARGGRRSTAPGRVRRFWQVTLPLLSPTIFFAVVVGSIFAFQTFGQIDLLTQGGPLKRTNVLTYFIYNDAAAGQQRRQGRGARDRAVRDHVRAHAGPDARARAAGALWPLTRPTAPPERSPDRAAMALRYLLLTVLAVVVLFPLYITVVNSLLTPAQIAARPPTFFPTNPEWGTLLRRVERRAHGPLPLNSAIVTDDHHRRPGRHRDPRRLRVRVPRVPVQAHAVRRVPRDADGAVRGHDRHQPHDDQRPRLVQLVPGPRGAVPRDRVRRVPDAPGVPAGAARPAGRGVARRLRALAVHDPGRGAARPSRGRARSACSRSSARGTSTSGRCSSPRTTQYRTVQIGLKQLRATSIDQVNVTFAGVVIAALPLVILLLLFQKQLVRGLTPAP